MDKLIYHLVKFHGHLGPYLVVGHRMALVSNSLQGKDPTNKRVIVRTGTKPPLACIIDGIQFTSGCTLGRGKIQILEEGIPEATFVLNGNKVTIKLKHQFRIKTDELEELALEIMKKPTVDLFEIHVED